MYTRTQNIKLRKQVSAESMCMCVLCIFVFLCVYVRVGEVCVCVGLSECGHAFAPPGYGQRTA